MDELFTCKDCGNHDLIVTHQWSVRYQDMFTDYREWGYLDENHHWTIEETETLDSYTANDYVNDPETYEETEEVVDEDSHEFFVNCAGCNREIVFGWSHPGRGGRIWPIECTDFIPGLSWFDPRYDN